MSNDVCDVWLDMLSVFVEKMKSGNCVITDLGLDRFLQHAVAMMKDFNDLVIGSLEVTDMMTILAFTDLLFDNHLFDVLMNNVQALPTTTERDKQAGVLFLILEVIELKRRFYEQVRSENSDKLEKSDVVHLVESCLQSLSNSYEKYIARINKDFADCTRVVDYCNQAVEFWKRDK
jgi:hypothetical protein